MTTTNESANKFPTLVKWNWNDLKSIKSAERKKAKLENAGFTQVHTFVNSITGECSLAYYKTH